MKKFARSLGMAALLAAWLGQPMATSAQGASINSFTYQGRLSDTNGPVNGLHDFTFSLHGSSVGLNQIGTTLTRAFLPVSNGLFSVPLEFTDAGSFPGADRWLEIGVRRSGAGATAILSPRQQITAAPYAIRAATSGIADSATSLNAANIVGTLAASQISGALLASQLPSGVVTNGAAGVNLSGTFSGGFGGLTNLNLSVAGFGSGVNRFRFNDAAGSQQIYLHAGKNMDLETVNDATFWVGHDFIATIDYDSRLHVKHDADITVDNNLSLTTGAGLTASVGNDMTLTVAGNLGVTSSSLDATYIGNAALTVGSSLSTSVGLNSALTVGNNLNVAAGNNLLLETGNRLGLLAPLGVGVGTMSPQANLHVYSANNPTVVRVQSTGTPGFGRLEFVSNPQGDFNEWRPGYIQSTDSGGFTGGLSFVVNGTGGANKFGEVEAMRIVNGRVGIGNSAPSTLFQVGNATCNGTLWANASDRNLKGNFAPVDGRKVLEQVAALPIHSWSYTNDLTARHVGPMAQDFQSSFGLNGDDDKHIATVDADGVALAAIQGLNQIVREKDAKIRELEQRLERLEDMVLRTPKP